MKNLFLLLALGYIFIHPPAQANHITGAEITYEYIGDSTGVQHEYMIYVNIYKNSGSPVSLPASEQAEVKSSCFPDSSFNLNRFYKASDSVLPDNGIYLEDYGNCVDKNGPGFIPISIFRYRGTATLPAPCNDVVFSWSECCRPINVSNLQSPSNKFFYVEAQLNTNYGPNTAPKFLNEGAAAFCIGQNVQWPQSVIEPDQDSISFQLAQPLTYPKAAIPFESGYSLNQPIMSSSGVTFNNQQGFSFTPSNPEIDAVKIKATEYRYDTTAGSWVVVGSVERDMQVVIVGSCDSSAMNIEFGVPDTISISNGAFELPCGTDTIRLTTSTPVLCDSISTSGHFRLINLGDLVAQPLINSGSNCGTNGYTNSFWLYLYQGLSENQYYLLQIKGNRLINKCGFQNPDRDSVLFFVQDCSGVGLEEEWLQDISLHPNPTSGTFSIDFATNLKLGKIALSDVNGKVVSVQNIRNESTKKITLDQPPGLYFLNVISGDRHAVFKVWKE